MNNRSDDAVAAMDGCLARVVDRERVTAVQATMPPDADVEQVADVFALLGDVITACRVEVMPCAHHAGQHARA
jgi:hypothetical protein